MHPVFAFCLQVWRRYNIQTSKMAHSAGEKYIIVLKGLVSWGKKEASDDKLDKNFQKSSSWCKVLIPLKKSALSSITLENKFQN